MKRLMMVCLLGFFVMFTGSSLAVSKEYLFPSSSYKPPCDTSKITICTIEIWLAHKHKKQKKTENKQKNQKTYKNKEKS